MKKLLITASIVTLALSTQVFAHHMAPANNPSVNAQKVQQFKKHNGFELMEQQLNLTDVQKEQMKALRQKQMEASKPIFEQLKQKEAEAHELKGQLKDLRTQNKKEFEAILTEEQLQKFEELKAERKKNFEKNHKKNPNKKPCKAPSGKCNKK